MKRIAFFLLMVCVAFISFRKGDSIHFVVPQGFPKPLYDFSKNPLSPEKIALGRALFYDQILSQNNSISCASCHLQYTAFSHVDHTVSHGIDNRIGFRNAPALMNLAWQSSFMRDGAVAHLDMQALAPISNPVEMDENIGNVVKKLQGTNLYPKLFYRAFQDATITGEHTLKAIAQFVASLVSSNSKYDSVMRGQSAFTQQEQQGYLLFKKNCASCHKEPLFSNDAFENIGLSLDTSFRDYGRMLVTHNAQDSLKFRVPSLRNIEFSYPYMHDGRFKRLSQVLQHYASGIVPSKTLAKALQKPMLLSQNDQVDLMAFLLTLTDRTFLFNPEFSYPNKIYADTTKD